MSKELDYIADLERENRILKELLYCTKRSCNNCGKVNCENFQRQRIDCCGLWVSYKDYITDLENKIADIKANCDLAIEGRDIKIKELEKENAELKEKLKPENCLKLLAKEGYIKFTSDQLTKAKEIIRDLLGCFFYLFEHDNKTRGHIKINNAIEQAEQFIKEIEK